MIPEAYEIIGTSGEVLCPACYLKDVGNPEVEGFMLVDAEDNVVECIACGEVLNYEEY